MRSQGTVTDWDDQKGFGFITPADGGRRVFVHISALPRGRRPALGDVLSYTEARDARNRLRATEVRPAGGASRPAGRPGLARAVVGGSAFLALVLLLALVDRVPLVVPAVYVVLSLMSFGLYASDKAAAQRGARRVPESTLHLLDVLGGWPGGLVARHAVRHKTRKQPFRTVFWGTVLANVAGLAWLVLTPALR